MAYKDKNSPAAKAAARRSEKKYYEKHREERLAAAKIYGPEYYAKNRERILAKSKEYQDTHRESGAKNRKAWAERNKEKMSSYYRQYAEEHRDEKRQANRDYKQKLRDDCFAAYGNKCACCGDEHKEFFAMDHMKGGGGKHRKEEKSMRQGAGIHKWLKEHGYPKDFQILCHNCNASRGYFGFCPHDREPEYGVEPAC